jgi:hypothetical protein
MTPSRQSKGREARLLQARTALKRLDMPRGQQNERAALCLLALLNLRPSTPWPSSTNPLLGITPIMEWAREHFGKAWKPNTRETVRRQTMHQFVQAGIAVLNPDDPDRPINSPATVYQISPDCLGVLQKLETPRFEPALVSFLRARPGLARRYAKERVMRQVPVQLPTGEAIRLSPGKHSQLIRGIIEEFAPRYILGGQLIYVGDTGGKLAYFERELPRSLGIQTDDHGKMPDVVFYWAERRWLFLIEAVTSHGPMDPKRHQELAALFRASNVGLIYVSAFPDRRAMNKYLDAIAWETEVWVADSPSHLIHFDGERFLGPYPA